MAATTVGNCGIPRRKASQAVTFCVKEERNASYRKVTTILQKAEIDRTDDDKAVLFSCSDLVQEVTQRIEKRQKVKDRLLEIQDEPELLDAKCLTLAQALVNSRHLVVYTGAGISTSACIPDYRGTNGIWTLLQQGKDIGLHDLTRAEPTRTHMALAELHRYHVLRHLVSQNCDGLHLRSGLPRHALSEVHGNMYIEVCPGCKREYWRLFDVTENTARYSHKTMRRCYACSAPLKDTIVHFGERGTLQWPLNWPGASVGADKADVILCIGSSLKVLKKYPWLWGMDKPVKKRPKLYIINLQWTPKDDTAVLKISGKCDEVMEKVMSHLHLPIPVYNRELDPMFHHASVLNPLEEHTTSQPNLTLPSASRPLPTPDKTAIDSKPLLPSERKPDRAFTDDAPAVKAEMVPDCAAIKAEMVPDCAAVRTEPETNFQFVDINSTFVKMEPRKSENPFGRTEILLANFGDNCVGFPPGFNGIFSAFNPFGHFSLSHHAPAGFFAALPAFALPLPLFYPAFQLDHNYSKLVRFDDCDAKIASITRDDTQAKSRESVREVSGAPSVAVERLPGRLCSFCDVNYKSRCCLYYSKYEAVFDAVEKASSQEVVVICECCDGGDDEEEGNSDGDQKTDDGDDSLSGGSGGGTQATKVPIVNPGWYGKGCRKRIKKKR